jgi:predicted aspartyl protease
MNWQRSINTSVDRAVLDTGAPYTIVPMDSLRRCNVMPVSQERVLKVAGEEFRSRQCPIIVKFFGVEQRGNVFYWERDYALLGRDLLQYYRLEFNGPSRVVRVITEG